MLDRGRVEQSQSISSNVSQQVLFREDLCRNARGYKVLLLNPGEGRNDRGREEQDTKRGNKERKQCGIPAKEDISMKVERSKRERKRKLGSKDSK